MTKYILLPLVLALTSSCMSFSSHSVYNPKTGFYSFFSPMMCIDSIEKINQETSAIVSKNGTLLEENHPLFVNVKTTIEKIFLAYEDLVKLGYFRNYSPLMYPYKNVEDNLRIYILSVDEPRCYSYPNNVIFLSRSMLESSSGFGVKNQAQLAGILSHELIHIIHGHSCYQWRSVDGFNDYQNRNLKNNFICLSRFLPISICDTESTTVNSSNIKSLDQKFEYIADMATIRILRQMKLDPIHYQDFLGNFQVFLLTSIC